MNRIFQWLRRFGTFVFVQNMNVLIVDGKRSDRTPSYGRTAQRLLPSGAPTEIPTLEIRLAGFNRRERLLESRGNEFTIREGWRETLRDIGAR
jgi:hypothetical protein